MERKGNHLADWDRLNWNHEQNRPVYILAIIIYDEY